MGVAGIPRDWQHSPCSAGSDPDSDCGGLWPVGSCRRRWLRRLPAGEAYARIDALPLTQPSLLPRFGMFAPLALVVYTGLYKPTLTHFIALL